MNAHALIDHIRIRLQAQRAPLLTEIHALTRDLSRLETLDGSARALADFLETVDTLDTKSKSELLAQLPSAHT
jgi:hypothetical protein